MMHHAVVVAIHQLMMVETISEAMDAVLVIHLHGMAILQGLVDGGRQLVLGQARSCATTTIQVM